MWRLIGKLRIFFSTPRGYLIANVAAGSSLFTLGDVVAQKLEKYFLKKVTSSEDTKFNWLRTAKFFSIATALAPLGHYYYIALDKYLKGRTSKIIVQKILVDQIFCGLIFYTLFLFGLSIMDGHSFKSATKEVVRKMPTVYVTDCCVWPFLQAINFYFLPTHLRVVYVAVCGALWDVFLSYYYFTYSENTENQLIQLRMLEEK